MYKININIIIAVILSIVTLLLMLFLSQIVNEPLLFYLGIAFSLNVLFFFLHLSKFTDKKLVLSWKITVNRVLYLLTVLSVLTVLLIPTYSGSLLYWMEIPAVNWLRFLSSTLLTTFLPGYFLLKIIDRKSLFSNTTIIVFSFLLSIFISFLLGFSALLTSNSISSVGLQVVLAINILLATIHAVLKLRKEGEKLQCNTMIESHLTEVLLLASILFTVIIFSLFVMYYNFPLTVGDMWYHQSLALQYSNHFPVYADLLIPGYPYLFHIYLAVISSISGIPSAVTEQSLIILNFIPVLALYSTLKQWFMEKKYKHIPAIATFLSILLGFGGLYAIYLSLTSSISIQSLLAITTSKTYDVFLRIIFNPMILAPFAIIGIPVFLVLLGLLREYKVSKFVVPVLISIFITIGYFGYMPAIIIFLLFFVFYSIISPDFELKINLSILFGLFYVLLIDLAAPVQAYSFSIDNLTGQTNLSLEFSLAFLLLALGTVISIIKSKFSLNALKSVSGRFFTAVMLNWKYLRWLFLYSYFLSIIIWFSVLDNLDVWSLGGYLFVPFFVFPIRFGPVGLIAVLTIFAFLPEIVQDRRYLFFLILIVVGFSLEQLSNHQVISLYFSYRYATFTFLGACLIAAYGLNRSKLLRIGGKSLWQNKRKIMGLIALFVIVISGVFSTSLSYLGASYYSSRTMPMNDNEFQALNYIRQNLPVDNRIITFSDKSSKLIETFAAVNPAQNFKAYTYILLDATEPQIIEYLLSSSNVKYVYVAQRDSTVLNASRGLFRYLLPFFPKVLQNEDVTVYAVPSLSYPKEKSSLGILQINASTSTFDGSLLWSFVDTSGNWTDHKSYSDGESFHFSVTSNQDGQVWACYSSQYLSLNTSIYHDFSFSYQVKDNTWLSVVLVDPANHWIEQSIHLSEKSLSKVSLDLPENKTIAFIKIYVSTTANAPRGTTAQASIQHVKLSGSSISGEEAFPSLLASIFNLQHSYLTAEVPKIPNEHSLIFDGKDDTVEVIDTDSLDATTGLTIEAWINPSNISGFHTIVGKRGIIDGVDYCNYNFRIQDGYLKFYFKGSDGNFSAYMSKDKVIAIGEQYHVAVTYISGNASSLKLYVNGEVVQGSWVVGTGNANLVPNGVNLCIGSNLYPYDREFFSGIIDEIRIFNQALSEKQLRASYNRGFAKVESGCVLCQRMEEGTGKMVNDASAYENTGNINGATWKSYSSTLTANLLSKNSVFLSGTFTEIMLTCDPSDGLDFSQVLEWVSNGGTLIVPDTAGLGFFSDLLQLQQTAMMSEVNKITNKNSTTFIPSLSLSPLKSNDPEVIIVWSYGDAETAGFLFQKNYGSGKILYIDIDPLIKNRSVLAVFELLKSNPDFIPTITSQQSSLKAADECTLSYNSASGEILVYGNMDCASNYISIKGSFISTDLSYKSSSISEIDLYEAQVKTSNGSSLILPSNQDSLLIQSQAMNGKLVTNESSTIFITLTDGTVHKLSGSHQIHFNASNAYVTALSPSIKVVGKITFDSLDVRVRPAVPLAGISRVKAIAEGTVTFSVSYTTPNVMLFSSFNLNGSINKAAEAASTVKMNIPWLDILLSPYNIVLVCLIVTSIIVVIIAPKFNSKSYLKIRRPRSGS